MLNFIGKLLNISPVSKKIMAFLARSGGEFLTERHEGEGKYHQITYQHTWHEGKAVKTNK
jgi:hypothetical protein